MNAERERIEFLKRPENVALACEIVALFEKVELELTKKFWSEVCAEVSRGIASAGGWRSTRFPLTFANGFGLVIRPEQFGEIQIPDNIDRRLFVQIALEQEQNLKELYFGVSYNRKVTTAEKALVSAVQKPLQDKLVQLRYKAGDWNFSYIGWKYSEPPASSRAELLKAVATDESI